MCMAWSLPTQLAPPVSVGGSAFPVATEIYHTGFLDPSWASKARTILKQPERWYCPLLSWTQCDFPEVLGLVASPTELPRGLHSFLSLLPATQPGTPHGIQTLLSQALCSIPTTRILTAIYSVAMSRVCLSLAPFTVWRRVENYKPVSKTKLPSNAETGKTATR